MQWLSKTFFKLFEGRRDTYAVQRVDKDGKVYYFRVTGKEVTPNTLLPHFRGEEVIGFYPLLPDGACKFAAVDIDSPNFEAVTKIRALLPQPNYLERSRGGNHHIWMFFKEAIPVEKLEANCRRAVSLAKDNLKCHCSLYPLPTESKLGLLIALPLQGEMVPQKRSVFLNDEGKIVEDPHTLLRELKYTTLTYTNAKKTWRGEGKTQGDTSRSGYDFSLAQTLSERGFARQESLEVIKGRLDPHSTAEGYLNRTLDKATARTKQAAHIPVRSWKDIVPCDRESFFKTTEGILSVSRSQKQQLDIFYAVIAANLKTSGRPIWLLVIGPPGCGKTLPMMAVQHSPHTYACSSFRPAALISGWGLKGGQDMSLIPKLFGKVLLVKDMSSLLSQNRETVSEVLGLLRDAYDGSCNRPFGTGVERSYKSRFGFIGAATPDVDTHWSLNVRLGERFLRLRLSSTLDQVYGKIDKSLEDVMRETHVDSALEEASLGYLKHLLRPEPLPPLSMQKEIGRLAQLGAILRTSVARHSYSRQVLVVPEWEEATRYAKQLAKVAISLAFLRGKATNDEEEMDDLKTIIRSGMESRMEKLCKTLYLNPGATTQKLATCMGLNAGLVRVWIEDLNVARIVIGTRNSWELSWDFVPLIAGMLKVFKLWDK